MEEANRSRRREPPAGDDADFRLLIEASPTGMLLVDEEGTIVLVNSAIERVFGYGRSELVGRHVELRGVRREGGQGPIEVTLPPPETRDAERALRAKTRELERSNRELEQFAQVASHDLREPLRMIATYVRLLQKEYGGKLGPEADGYIRYAVEGAERLTRLVSDLLAYAKLGATRLPLEAIDCKALVGQVLAGLETSIAEARATVTVDPLPTVTGNPTELTQVLQNLVENALKFRGARSPTVRLSAQRGEGEWVFSCSDDGIGIEPRHHARIFEPFRRLHPPNAYPGTGLGLASCKKIVERRGGRIWVESNGSGSRFLFTVPDADASTAPAGPKR